MDWVEFSKVVVEFNDTREYSKSMRNKWRLGGYLQYRSMDSGEIDADSYRLTDKAIQKLNETTN